ncbi:hypothetical protein KIM372_16570 [Bombiscardovia nodaiensis]|uniref:PASTA domain-containing protein n=1 Tax=Bombiscardovia nodaiensis TaxID=2932181 RepID=A0ABN6SGQ0_9BIFI|nr:hypothetical protein KIM372_16570 [Bombiscardovia nodaiensis]
MNYCIQCGSPNNDRNHFCSKCGSKLLEEEVAPRPGASTLTPTANSEQTVSDTPAATVKHIHKRLIIGLSALAAVIVCMGSLGIFKTYYARTIPHIQGGSASDAVKQLKEAGIPAQTKLEFSPKRKGSFIRIDNAEEGKRWDRNTTVTVTESAGPGVPKGTVGQSGQHAQSTLEKMGLPLTVTDLSSRLPTAKGQVLATYPAEGQAVTDQSTGIHIGVGVNKPGIPAELAGLDKDKAQSQLSSQGFKVTLEPRFSSTKNLGKIVGANPSLGQITDSKTVTLFYGVDASERLDVVAPYPTDATSAERVANKEDRLVGHYCTDDGDCFNLENTSKDSYGSPRLSINGKHKENIWDNLSFCSYAEDIAGCIPTTNFEIDGKLPLSNNLIAGDSGAMELYEGGGLPYCGDIPFLSGIQVCINGQSKMYDDAGLSEPNYDGSFKNTGLQWKPLEFLLIMPVGAKLSQLESDGYFAGKSGYKPDPGRPYLIRRNNSKYKAQPASGKTDERDPFSPTLNGKADPFKDPPNRSNVYYLVENPYNWAALGGSEPNSRTK